MIESGKTPQLFIGDNPFQGIHHLSQARGRSRPQQLANVDHVARIVQVAHDNGAQGLFFTTSPAMLRVLEALARQGLSTELHVIIPNALSVVRGATVEGPVGLGRQLVRKMAARLNWRVMIDVLVGLAVADPQRLMRSWLLDELYVLRPMAQGHRLRTLFLHELVTDTALALNMVWPFRVHIESTRKTGLIPGFETRNLSLLAERFRKWQLSASGVAIAAPFNVAGFQMHPSREECERAARNLADASITGFSLLASGYVSLERAIEYVRMSPWLSSIAIGVSSEAQAQQTFSSLRQQLIADTHAAQAVGACRAI